jgi:hypothetical protein
MHSARARRCCHAGLCGLARFDAVVSPATMLHVGKRCNCLLRPSGTRLLGRKTGDSDDRLRDEGYDDEYPHGVFLLDQHGCAVALDRRWLLSCFQGQGLAGRRGGRARLRVCVSHAARTSSVRGARVWRSRCRGAIDRSGCHHPRQHPRRLPSLHGSAAQPHSEQPQH